MVFYLLILDKYLNDYICNPNLSIASVKYQLFRAYPKKIYHSYLDL